MPLLEQQELMEAPPARRMAVQPGREAWWGVDPGTVRLAVACVSPALERRTRTTSFAPLRGGQRLAAIYADTRRFVLEIVAAGWPLPGLVMFELPAGDPPNLELIYASGVQQAAMFDALYEAAGGPVVIETMPTASWKKTACGRGNIYKPTKKKLGRSPVFEDYGVAVWARENGYGGSSWDEVDALGLAEAARRTVALEPR